MSGTGNLFIVSGPSGAGKGTIVKELLLRAPAAWVSVSVTTRSPRPGEEDGVHYLFVSDTEFDGLVASGGLLEWASVHGNRYGTPREEVDRRLAEGKQVVLEIDPQGAFQVGALVPKSVLVFVMPPSEEELLRRLKKRGAETEKQIAVRLQTAEKEVALVGKYDHVIINDDVERAADELARLIGSYARGEESNTKSCQ
ncbi:MAG: guanylate kinase [Coriobacteriia bacterium]|nr:guanylate kinase [Coriobacteriia bacterium]